MRAICRRRLDRDRPGFGKPCDLCFGPFSSLCRVGFLEADSNTAGHVHTMRAGLSCSQLLGCNKLIELSTDSLGFSRRVAVLLIEQCDILLVKSAGCMSCDDGLLWEHLFCAASISASLVLVEAGALISPNGLAVEPSTLNGCRFSRL